MLLMAYSANSKCCKHMKITELHRDTHMRLLSESYAIHTNMTGFRYFSKNRCVLVLWIKVAPALEGLKAWQ